MDRTVWMPDMDAWGPPIDVLAVLADEQQHLLDLLAGLDRGQWATPTMCTGWSVHDLAAHVLGDQLGRLSRSRDGYEALRPRPGEPFPAFIDRINDEWVVAARRLSPDVLLALLADSSARTVEHWRSLDPGRLGEPVTWAGPQPAPVWLDTAREYTEYWVHQQQIREAVGVPPLAEARFIGPVVDTFIRALPHTLRAVDAANGAEAHYRVEGEGGGTWAAVRHDDQWKLEHRSQPRAPLSRSPLAFVSTDPDTFWRLCTRNLEPEQAGERVRREGDHALCEAMLRMVSIIVPERA